MKFEITYRDNTVESVETYSPDGLVIKIMQRIKELAPNADLTTQRVQSALIMACLLFEGKAQYPQKPEPPLFIIVTQTP